MRTSRNMSIVLASARACGSFRCSRTASLIWSPMVSTGFSDVIGSWKIIAMSLPRIFRISVSRLGEQVLPRSVIVPLSIRPGGLGISRMIESA